MCDYIKIQRHCSLKTKYILEEDIHNTHIKSSKILVSRAQKELPQINKESTNNPIDKGGKA